MIEIIVRNKIAKLVEPFIAICGNNDYIIRFNFDEEWDAYETKTARFKWNSSYVDIVFSGNECPMPVINDAYGVEIGIYAGDLHTTTGAYLPMKKSILCGGGVPADPPPDVYAQIMEKLNDLSEVDPDDIKSAVDEYMAENPVVETDPTVPAWAKQPEKPTYTADEVGALPDSYTPPEAPVKSVNGKTGAVTLTAEDLGVSSPEEFEILLTYDESAKSFSTTVTPAEVFVAYDAGKTFVFSLRYYGYDEFTVYPEVKTSTEDFMYYEREIQITALFDVEDSAIASHPKRLTVVANESNTGACQVIFVSDKQYALTINGKSYIPSYEPVDFTDTINDLINEALGVIENGSY